MTDTIRLVTRGDDSGSAQTANDAIRDAFLHGILRNTSLMVPGPYFREAAEMLHGLPGLCVGLHVTLNAEWDGVRWGPVLPADRVPALVDSNGHFYKTTAELAAQTPPLEQMLAEVRAQLDQARSAGLNIRYLDEHMGVGWINGLSDALADLCRQEGLVCSREALPDARLPRPHDTKPDRVQTLLDSLEAAEPGTYLLVGHPCYATPEMERYGHAGLEPGSVGPDRDEQRRLFMDPRILDACRIGRIVPIPYTEVVT